MLTDRRTNYLLGSAVVSTGLLAGLYFGFAVAVMPALHRLGDLEFIAAMQQIDDVIQNPAFFLVFLGAPALTIYLAVKHRHSRWLLWAAGLNVAGLLITMALNVPLNEDLVAAGAPARIPDPGEVRDAFETPWVAWNLVRTVLTAGALACVTKAILVRQRGRVAR